MNHEQNDKTMSRVMAALLAALLCAPGAPEAGAGTTPVGTAFTYQGSLEQSGIAVDSTADFQFTLWDALSAGVQVAGPVASNNVTVADGRFTTQMDFGASAFVGDARWLQIAVRSPAGSGTFTTLSPRQPLTATPYALHTRGMNVDPAGHVGIGTTTPVAALDVARNWDGEQGAINVVGDTPALRFTGGAAANNASWIEHLGAGGSLGFYRRIAPTAWQPALVMDGATGRVGIGSTTPDNALHVAVGSAGTITGYPLAPLIVENQSDCYINLLAPSAAEQGILFGDPGAGAADGCIIYNNASTQNGLQFRTNGNITKMVITAGGAVGIGTTFPNAALQVVGGVRGDHAGGGAAVRGVSAGTFGEGVEGLATSTTGTTVGVRGQSDSATGYDVYAGGAGINYGSPSSIRWKSNVEAITDPLGMLDRMRGVYFDWDAEHGGQHDIGFIGEEVGKVLPEVVGYEQDGEFVTGMDYSKLTPLLAEAVKALRAEKDAEMATLRNENQQLQDRLAALEAAMARISRQRSEP